MLETARLTIFPLSHTQLQLYLRSDQALEKSLGLRPHPRHMPPAWVRGIRQNILPAVANSDSQGLFSTLWVIVDKEKRLMVGELRFKGPPNEEGELEVGYGTYAEFRKRGYMYEAMVTLISWALGITEVQSILAQTDRHNKASHRILEKAGFNICRQSAWFCWWQLTKATFAGHS